MTPAVALTALRAGPGFGLAPSEVWSAWHWDPWIYLPLLISGGLYIVGVRTLWGVAGEGHGVRRMEVGAFLTGLWVLAMSLLSPIHAAGGVLFSLHMVQHVLLLVVAAPLLILGRPLVVYLWALPPPVRKGVGRVLARRPARAILGALGRPAVGWLLYAGIVWIWHLPTLYEAALLSEWVHALQHGTFVLAAVVFWWAALEFGRRRSGGYGLGIIYFFTTALHGSAFGALLTFAREAWYPFYEGRTAAWELTALQDQQLGGLVMWVPAGLVYLAAALIFLLSWVRASERAALRREGRNASSPSPRPSATLPGALLLLLTLVGVSGCDRGYPDREDILVVPGGDASRAPAIMARDGCTGCHVIPGIGGPSAWVGPPLTAWSRRIYIAGTLPNSPDNLVAWLLDPPAVRDPTAMPRVGLTEDEARHLAAYLFTLR
jgi:putative membrane protein